MAAKKTKIDAGSPFAVLQGLKDELAEQEAAKKKAAAAKGTSGARPATKPAVPPGKRPELQSKMNDLDFHRLMGGVVPLADIGKTRIPVSASKIESLAQEMARRGVDAKNEAELEAEAVHEHLRTLVDGPMRFEVQDDGRRVEGRRTDLPVESVRKLRRGLLPIDARIDLHGMKAGDAREALEAFLRDQRARGERCVLVVHGKGEHSPQGLGVLRGEMAAWLSQGRASEHVAAFTTSLDPHGGEGAVYVLLRRV